ncbi:DnaD domain protein [Jeotgalibaca caeni]|uniref:DnaD domain protein n=1 Tax=Jeotgalibaca caeni TaxID=3028623 RepID=UPI00237E7453|nr:DnaD domain protein [Jeotgalibaca caeni]MDE1549923.1 DnaD domain protein [Jeotgalibaca caeni]
MTNNQDILALGYGIIPKKVMKDPDLTIEAKAIYSYIASYAGAGNTAFPSVDLICHDLNIGKDRFRKHRKLLLEKGYLVVEQHSNAGKYSNNLYTIPQTISTESKTEATELEEPLPDFTASEFQVADSSSTKNRTLNKNSGNTNSFKKNKNLLEEDDDEPNLNKHDFIWWEENWTAHLGSYPPYTKKIHQALQRWIEFFGDEEMVQHAFLLASKYGAKSYAYLECILKNWRDEGIETIEEVYDRELSERQVGY